MKVFFLKGLDSKPDLENNASHSKRKLDESIDGCATTKLIAALKECQTILDSFETKKKIKSSSSGNEDETEVDVLDMDDEISDEKHLKGLREADRYDKKKMKKNLNFAIAQNFFDMIAKLS
jgi:hypothetical protein